MSALKLLSPMTRIITSPLLLAVAILAERLENRTPRLLVSLVSDEIALGEAIEEDAHIVLQNDIVLTPGGSEGSKFIVSGVQGLVIDGRGHSLGFVTSDSENGRVFWIDAESTVKMTNLTLVNGHVSSTYDTARGGAIYIAGRSSLAMESAEVSGHKVESSNGAEGGAIYSSSSTVTLTSCWLPENMADGSSSGGAIYSYESTINLHACTLARNTATGSIGALGGAIYSYSSTVTLSLCTVSKNAATAEYNSAGGGIHASGIGGILSLADCKVLMNSPGGLYITGQHRLSGVFFSENDDYDIGGTSSPVCESYCFAGGYGNATGCANISGSDDVDDHGDCLCGSFDGCVACPAGTFNTRDYSKSIDDCPACGAGLVSSSGAADCSSCTVGKYASNNAGETESGLLNPVASGATVCNPCSAGYKAARGSQFICQACDAGKSSAAGSSECVDCPAGKRAGGGDAACTDCLAGTYANKTAAAFCEDCPGDGYSLSGSTTCTLCNKLFYYSRDGRCIRCPEGTDCPADGGSTLEEIAVVADFWRIAADSPIFLGCPRPGACVGGAVFADNGNGYCEEGYEGPLCAVCADGYFFDDNENECATCGDEGLQILTSAPVIILAVVLFVAMVAWILRSFGVLDTSGSAHQESTAVDDVGRAAQRPSLVMDHTATTSEWTASILLVLKRLQRKFVVRLKAMYSFFQIVVNLGFNCTVRFPAIFERVVAKLKIVNLDVVGSLGLSCIAKVNYIDAMVFTTLVPIVIAVLIWVKYCMISCLSVCGGGVDTPAAKGERLASHMYTFLILTYLVLIGASSKILHFYKCHEFELPNGGSERYLWLDYSVDCDSSEYQDYMVFAGIMVLVYPVGIPLLYFVMVHRHRNILSDEDAVEEEAMNGHPRTGHVSFLTENYNTDCFWFESLECLRRLLLAAIVGIVSENAAAAPVLGILIAAAFTYIITRFRPFKESDDNLLGDILSYSLLLFFVAALMVKAEMTSDDDGDQETFGSLLIFILILAPLTLTLITVMQLLRVASSVATRSCRKKENTPTSGAAGGPDSLLEGGGGGLLDNSSAEEGRSESSIDRPPSSRDV